MIGMYWDTSTDWIVVEVFEFDSAIEQNVRADFYKSVYSYKEFRPRDASTKLVLEIQKALQFTKIKKPDWIFVAQGPGSFTGIRLSVATARNLSQLWNVPCVGLDTMEIYRKYYSSKSNDKSFVSVLDGKMNRYFVGLDDETESGKRSLTLDIEIKELKKHLDELKNKGIETNVVSYTTLEIPHKLMSEDFPQLKGIPLNDYWNPEYLQNSIERFSYQKLLPKYMRDTYARKTVPTN